MPPHRRSMYVGKHDMSW